MKADKGGAEEIRKEERKEEKREREKKKYSYARFQSKRENP